MENNAEPAQTAPLGSVSLIRLLLHKKDYTLFDFNRMCRNVEEKIAETSCKEVRVMYTPLHPTFIYSKTGVYRGIHFFLFLL